MLVAVRQNKIVDIVNERKMIRVSELSDLFKVTEETIRRDLEKLESQGKLLRTHGGAISVKEEEGDIPHFQREVINKKEKMAVAKEAAKLIKERDIIFLDASSTALYLARYIPNIPLTVLTNSVPVCLELAKNKNIQVISTGGSLSTSSMSFLGPLALRALERYHVNKLFFSCKGVHENWGISDSNELQALVKQKMIQMADMSCLLLDHTKLGKKAFANITKINDIDILIVDSQGENRLLQRFAEEGIKIIKAPQVI